MVVVLVTALLAAVKTTPAPLEEGAGNREWIGMVNITRFYSALLQRLDDGSAHLGGAHPSRT